MKRRKEKGTNEKERKKERKNEKEKKYSRDRLGNKFKEKRAKVKARFYLPPAGRKIEDLL